MSMRIRWVGPQVVRRVVEGFVWDAGTGFVQDVPEELALELLTAPGEHFEQVEDAAETA